MPLILIGILLLALYIILIEPMWPQVRYEEVHTKGTQQVRVLFITDIHMTWFRFPVIEWAQKRILYRLLTTQHFDAVLLGGDFIDHNPSVYTRDRLYAFLRWLQHTGVPAVGVLGNHDHQFLGDYSLHSYIEHLKATGITLLQDEITKITLNSGGTLRIAGLTDLEVHPDYDALKSYASKQAYADVVASMRSPFAKDSADILLTHNPDGAYLAGECAPVTLAGHTHGGQYWVFNLLHKILPVLPAPPGRFRTWAGHTRINSTELIVSTGIGSSTLPGRFGVRPQFVIVELLSSK
jgi:hypothetical protein